MMTSSLRGYSGRLDLNEEVGVGKLVYGDGGAGGARLGMEELVVHLVETCVVFHVDEEDGQVY